MPAIHQQSVKQIEIEFAYLTALDKHPDVYNAKTTAIIKESRVTAIRKACQYLMC